MVVGVPGGVADYPNFALVRQVCASVSRPAELVASVQGLTPAYSYVVAPWSDYEPQIFRMDDYAAYYRRVRDGLARAIDEHGGPEIGARCSGSGV